MAQGISVVHLYSSQLASLSIRLPELSEQNKIASFLSKLDDRISTQNKIIQQLESLIQGLTEQIFKQKIRFSNNEKQFLDWKVVTLSEIAEKRILKNKDNKIRNVFTNSALQGVVDQKDYFDKEIANQNNLLGYFIVETDDFVYNPRISNYAPVGPISRNKLETGVMSPLYSVFRFTKGNLDYMEYFFSSTVWHKHMKEISNSGVRDDRMSFLINDFFKMVIPYPEIEEQNRISSFLSSIDQKIETEKKILAQYENQKKYLLQNLFI